MVISRHSGTAEVSGQTHTLEMYHYYSYTVE